MGKGETVTLSKNLRDLRGFYKMGTPATIQSVRKDSLGRECFFIILSDNSEHLVFQDEIQQKGRNEQ